MNTIDDLKTPERGEMVLAFSMSDNEDAFDAYRAKVLASGGRIRRAVGVNSLVRHLMVYQPTFIVYIP